MRRSFKETREEVVRHLRMLQKALQAYEKEPDPSFIFADKLNDIYESINMLRHALRQADYYHSQGKYSKAIDILEDALDKAFYDPDLDFV